MRSLYFIVFSLLLLVIVGCGDIRLESKAPEAQEIAGMELNWVAGDVDFGSGLANGTYAVTTLAANGAVGNSPTERDKKVIKTGHIDLEVEDIAVTYQQLYGLAQTYNASIANDTKNESEYRINASMTLRIPNSKFEQAVMGIDKLDGKLISKNINQVDVSEQFTDLVARIKTKKGLEERYLDILVKANKVKDLLEVERELEAVRSEIERMEARLNGMKDKIAYSTLTVNYYQYKEPTKPVLKGFGKKLTDSLKLGWQGIGNFVLAMAIIWPVWIIGLAIGYLVYRKVRK